MNSAHSKARLAVSLAIVPWDGLRRLRRMSGLFLALGVLPLGCGSKVASDGAASSQTHWLAICSVDSDCNGLACVCGVCTQECTDDTECSGGKSAACNSTAAGCGANAPASVCLATCSRDEQCGAGRECVEGGCRLPEVAATDGGQLVPMGGACDSNEDCATGLCAGQGCGPGEGVCVFPSPCPQGPESPVCDCSGATVLSGCLEFRYEHLGACAGDGDAGSDVDGGTAGGSDAGTLGLTTGSPCSDDTECASGACTAACDGVLRCADPCNADASNAVCDCNHETQAAFDGCGSVGFVGACSSGSQPDGAACEVDADCASGICEGEGCGPFQGVCMAVDRVCTDDLREYCGCDGQTVIGGSSCAGARYAHDGKCEAELTPAGGSCDVNADCESGLCEGEGCGPGEGICADPLMECTADVRPYCSCDGNTVGGSSSCPGTRYQYEGACEP